MAPTRYTAAVAVVTLVCILLSSSAWYIGYRCDQKVPVEEFDRAVRVRSERIRATHEALVNCSNSLADVTGQLRALNASLPSASTTELQRELRRALKRIKLELRPIDGCRDEEWPGRPAAQATLRGPKRQVRVLAWRPPSIFPNAHRAKHLVPVPRGMEAYYTAAGVDIVDGKIPADFVGGGSYKTICDGLAVRHSNFSEFWDSDVVFLDNPIAGGTTEDYAEDLLPPRAAHHLWVLRFAGEPLSYYPAMGNPRFLAKFNYTIGYHRGLYHLHAVPYIDLNMTRILRNPLNDPFTTERNESASIVMFISNCLSRNQRTAYVQELMNLVPVHSYGRCMANKKIPEEVSIKHGALGGSVGDWRGVKMDVIRRYKFLIAFENSDCFDYVTEKVYDGLNTGTIPIYMGAPNIRDFVPDHSVIHAADFREPAALARYLELVASVPQLYNSYHEWRKHPLPERLERLRRVKKSNICDFVQHLQWA